MFLHYTMHVIGSRMLLAEMTPNGPV